MAKSLMVMGTTPKSGKSFFISALCRIFANDGYKVVPFKAQSITSSTIYTEDGFEMDAQTACIAEVAGEAPDIRMNPVLLKPCGDEKYDVTVCGKLLGAMTLAQYAASFDEIAPDIIQSYKSLATENDIVLIEADGTPSEGEKYCIGGPEFISLLGVPVIIISDYSKGGAFSSAYGSFAFADRELKKLVKGFVINKLEGSSKYHDRNFIKLRELTSISFVCQIEKLDIEALREKDKIVELAQQSAGDGIVKTNAFFQGGSCAQDTEFRGDYGNIEDVFPSFSSADQIGVDKPVWSSTFGYDDPEEMKIDQNILPPTENAFTISEKNETVAAVLADKTEPEEPDDHKYTNSSVEELENEIATLKANMESKLYSDSDMGTEGEQVPSFDQLLLADIEKRIADINASHSERTVIDKVDLPTDEMSQVLSEANFDGDKELYQAANVDDILEILKSSDEIEQDRLLAGNGSDNAETRSDMESGFIKVIEEKSHFTERISDTAPDQNNMESSATKEIEEESHFGHDVLDDAKEGSNESDNIPNQGEALINREKIVSEIPQRMDNGIETAVLSGMMGGIKTQNDNVEQPREETISLEKLTDVIDRSLFESSDSSLESGGEGILLPPDDEVTEIDIPTVDALWEISDTEKKNFIAINSPQRQHEEKNLFDEKQEKTEPIVTEDEHAQPKVNFAEIKNVEDVESYATNDVLAHIQPDLIQETKEIENFFIDDISGIGSEKNGDILDIFSSQKIGGEIDEVFDRKPSVSKESVVAELDRMLTLAEEKMHANNQLIDEVGKVNDIEYVHIQKSIQTKPLDPMISEEKLIVETIKTEAFADSLMSPQVSKTIIETKPPHEPMQTDPIEEDNLDKMLSVTDEIVHSNENTVSDTALSDDFLNDDYQLNKEIPIPDTKPLQVEHADSTSFISEEKLIVETIKAEAVADSLMSQPVSKTIIETKPPHEPMQTDPIEEDELDKMLAFTGDNETTEINPDDNFSIDENSDTLNIGKELEQNIRFLADQDDFFIQKEIPKAEKTITKSTFGTASSGTFVNEETLKAKPVMNAQPIVTRTPAAPFGTARLGIFGNEETLKTEPVMDAQPIVTEKITAIKTQTGNMPSAAKRVQTDGLSSKVSVAVIKLPNTTFKSGFEYLGEKGMNVFYPSSANDFGKPDFIVIPDTLKPMSDLVWMRDNGLETAIKLSLHENSMLLGVCGGYHMLSETIFDPSDTDMGGEFPGMGLLKIKTTLVKHREITRIRGIFKSFEGLFSPLNGKNFEGSAIFSAKISRAGHKNISIIINKANGMAFKDGICDKNVMGVNVFGILHNNSLLNAISNVLMEFKEGKNIADSYFNPKDDKTMAFSSDDEAKLSIDTQEVEKISQKMESETTTDTSNPYLHNNPYRKKMEQLKLQQQLKAMEVNVGITYNNYDNVNGIISETYNAFGGSVEAENPVEQAELVLAVKPEDFDIIAKYVEKTVDIKKLYEIISQGV